MLILASLLTINPWLAGPVAIVAALGWAAERLHEISEVTDGK